MKKSTSTVAGLLKSVSEESNRILSESYDGVKSEYSATIVIERSDLQKFAERKCSDGFLAKAIDKLNIIDKVLIVTISDRLVIIHTPESIVSSTQSKLPQCPTESKFDVGRTHHSFDGVDYAMIEYSSQ